MPSTIAVLDSDQLREVIRSEIAAAFDQVCEMLRAATQDLEEVRRKPPADALGGGLIDAKAVAEALRTSRRDLRRMVLAGSFPPPIRVGVRRIRWRLKDVVEWMEAQRAENHVPR